MSKTAAYRPPALSNYFEAPDGFTGHFGWLCGFSADVPFLRDAVERFTQATTGALSLSGQLALALMLDPAAPQLSITRVPGVAHLPLRRERPFRLLHAKVALLGFVHAREPDRWQLRLLVSTGNWTRQTVEESLDLAWSVTVDSSTMAASDCADVKAAAGFLDWLEARHDDGVLSALAGDGGSIDAHERRAQVRGWIARCRRRARGEPRFMDNRQHSFLAQLPGKVAACSGEVRRNYLAMGAGFYEALSEPPVAPVVPGRIIAALRERHLTRTAGVDLFVNPHACQSIARSVSALSEQGVTVRSASVPEGIFHETWQRTLHAKFLFGANSTPNGSCNHPWVYLGSGNLTPAGFLEKASPAHGNLEAGVVFSPGVLYWERGLNAVPAQVVTNLLPISWGEDCLLRDGDARMASGEPWVYQDEGFAGMPLTWLAWKPSSAGYPATLHCAHMAELDADVQLLDADGDACERIETGFIWHGAEPREVRLQWRDGSRERQAWVPVVDVFGRVGASGLTRLDIDDVLDLLSMRRGASDNAQDETPVDVDGSDAAAQTTREPGATGSADYSIRRMMQLLETVARRHTPLGAPEWRLWCLQLEQWLMRMAQSEAVAVFRCLGVNPVSPLYAAPFRPDFACDGTSREGQCYEALLDRVAIAWGVQHLSTIAPEES